MYFVTDEPVGHELPEVSFNSKTYGQFTYMYVYVLHIVNAARLVKDALNASFVCCHVCNLLKLYMVIIFSLFVVCLPPHTCKCMLSFLYSCQS